MNEQLSMPCRKCGAPNPPSNQYCRKCGVVLSLSTAMMQRQGKPILPPVREVSWHMVLLACALCLGFSVLTQGTLAAISVGLGLKLGPDLGSAMRSLVGVLAISGGLFLLSCALTGAAITWLARRTLVKEPAIGVVLMSAVVGGCLAVLSTDALVVAAIASVPGAAAAALGGLLGPGART
ncbi:MAG: hypothetical protein MUC50_11965 [Myxococcota bacterium]|jgi:hypothetical protein|nr:hypothetical protein [Myxococcota bacterium]